ncbi:MAG TPA: LuxR C-terminal-related transcriptional regulator [Bacteroidia bacterium]|nr:LuxR C-terminal-related transcriptional regulator [Bacteroidia bacterium]
MHRPVNLRILGAGGTHIAAIAVDAEKLPELEQRLSAFAEHNPGLAQEEIVYTILFKSEQDKNRLLREFEKETGLHIVRIDKKPEPDEPLTAREQEVLELLERGLAYKLIADALCISEGTMNTHIKNIYGKLHVHNRTEAVRKWRKNNEE